MRLYCIAVAFLSFAITLTGCRSAKSEASSELSKQTAIAAGAPTMTADDVERVVSAKFDIVSDIAALPEPVKRSFCNLEHCDYEGVKFDMVNPGEPMSDDAIEVGVPNKRLRFAALNDTSAIVFYEWGSYVGQDCVAVFDFQHRKSWGGSLTNHRVTTLEQLRSAIRAKQFVQWDANSR